MRVVGNLVDFRVSSLVKDRHDVTASPDFDNPITKAMLASLPSKTYAELTAIRKYLMTHRPGVMTKASTVDTWMTMVNDEIKRRDDERAAVFDDLCAGKLSLVDVLKKGNIR